MSYRILLCGGGSGGHVYPLVAVAESLKEMADKDGIRIKIKMMGDGAFIEEAARENNIPFTRIISGKRRTYSSFRNFADLFKVPLGVIQALWHVFWFMPDVIFSKGGYASVLPVLAGRFYMIPVYIHETDSVPGRANKFLSRRARKIFISFEGSTKYFNPSKTILVGNPIRNHLFGASKEEGLSRFKLDQSLKTVLVIGGSQGAKIINNVITEALVRLVQKYQVIHQCGENNLKGVQDEVSKFISEGQGGYGQMISDRYRPLPFLNERDLALAYAASDVIVSRAGGALFEIAAAAKPAIVIPIKESNGDHQLQNAVEFSKYGGQLIEEDNLTANILINRIEFLLDPENYNKLSEQARSFAKPDAARQIALVLLGKN